MVFVALEFDTTLSQIITDISPKQELVSRKKNIHKLYVLKLMNDWHMKIRFVINKSFTKKFSLNLSKNV